MPIAHLVAAFFAGAFLANSVPHFVSGVCGDPFPTPFAKPPGKGLSSPLVNVLWGLLNMIAGTILFRRGEVAGEGSLPLPLFFAGAAIISIFGAIHFAKKDPR